MGSYKVYAFLVGYIVFMTFILGEIEQYNVDSTIEQVELDKPSGSFWDTIQGIIYYLNIFWSILTFNITAGTETIPTWFNLLLVVPFYALIIYFIADILLPTVSD